MAVPIQPKRNPFFAGPKKTGQQPVRPIQGRQPVRPVQGQPVQRPMQGQKPVQQQPVTGKVGFFTKNKKLVMIGGIVLGALVLILIIYFVIAAFTGEVSSKF